MMAFLRFNCRKATQAINFFARSRTGNRISKLQALKLVYLADRYHLRKFGRLITGDQYFAMEMGPVGSGVKDLAEYSNVLSLRELRYAASYIRPDAARKTVHSAGPVDEDELSATDMEALRAVDKAFGKPAAMRRLDLVELTHHFPEWKKHQNRVAVTGRECMDVEDFLLDAPESGRHELVPLTKQEQSIRLDELREASHLQSMWR